MCDTIHKFEESGLGKAPYRFIGMRENTYTDGAGNTKAGGCCDYCANGIQFEYCFQSTDGKVFKVGSDCALASGDSGLIDLTRRAMAEARRAAASKKYRALSVAAEEALPSAQEKLEALPHPTTPGKSLYDYVEWLLGHAGKAGKTKAYKIILKESAM